MIFVLKIVGIYLIIGILFAIWTVCILCSNNPEMQEILNDLSTQMIKTGWSREKCVLLMIALFVLGWPYFLYMYILA